MARPLRVHFPEAINCVTSRRLGGWNGGRELLFRSESDYLLKLSRYVHLNFVTAAGWAKRPIPERIRQLRYFPWIA